MSPRSADHTESIIRHLHANSGLALTTGALFVVGYFLWVDAQRTGGPPPALSTVGGPGETSVTPSSTGDNLMDRGPVALPSPKQQGAAQKKLVEGHWHGMEVIELGPELAREYGIMSSSAGLLVDEVTLEVAETGVLAGDVLFRLDAMEISTLKDFSEATYLLRNNHAVEMGILRGGRRTSVWLRTRRALGAAMFEAAPPVFPGAIAPHKDKKRPCTDCHLIMASGGQLAIDAGDLLPSPPPIAADAIALHGNRGPCQTCHRIVGGEADARRARQGP